MLACVGLPEAASSLERPPHSQPFTATAAVQLPPSPAPQGLLSSDTLDVYFLVNVEVFFLKKKKPWCFLSLRNLIFIPP